jgi:hypothetical protein
MAYDVYVRFKSFLPGGGYDSTGRPVQGKTNVRGVINVTSYTRGGETLRAQDVGLETIDSLDLELVEPFTSPNPSQNWRDVGYSSAAAQFYAWVEASSGAFAELAGASAFEVAFDAFGDAAHAPELL